MIVVIVLCCVLFCLFLLLFVCVLLFFTGRVLKTVAASQRLFFFSVFVYYFDKMAIYLTAGAVEKLANGDVRSEIQMILVLHVLKSTIVVVNEREAAVLWLTDGQGHEIRALLKGDLSLVKDKIIESGSNIQLLQFTTGTTRLFPQR